MHGWIIAAILKEMKDLKGLTSCESWMYQARPCEGASTLDVATCILRNVEEKCGARGAGPCFGGRSGQGLCDV